MKKVLSILKEKSECVLWCMRRSTKKRSRDNRSSSELSDTCHEVERRAKRIEHTKTNRKWLMIQWIN